MSSESAARLLSRGPELRELHAKMKREEEDYKQYDAVQAEMRAILFKKNSKI